MHKSTNIQNDPEASLEFKPEFIREVQESSNCIKKGGKTIPLKQFATP
jgi:hypothetical protein